VLECAGCHARVSPDADRCPRCGSTHLLAPPSLLQRRPVIVGLYALVIALAVLWLGAAFGVQFLAFGDRALAGFGYSPAQIGAEERHLQLRDRLRDAELTVPAFPGAARLKERSGRTYIETAPVLESCWAAPEPLAAVLAFYRGALAPDAAGAGAGAGARTGAGASGWRIRRDVPGSPQLGAESGQVRLLIRGPGPGLATDVECPPETVYVLSLVAFNPGR